MSWTSIPEAHQYWRLHRARTDAPDGLAEAESFILNQPPATAEEAACILDVVCANGGDARCDGLDYAALGRVRTFLLS